MSRSTVFINGKFLAQRTTGVQRVAREAVAALDQLLQDEACPLHFVLLCPANAERLDLKSVEQRPVPGPRSLHLWEQLALWRASRGGLLLNLAGSAPLLHARQFVSMYDAAVFDHPEAYRAAFVRWYRLAFAILKRRALRILTSSEFSRARLSARLGESSRFEVIAPGADHIVGLAADPSIIDRLRLTGIPYLLAVGSLNPTKNFARLVAAFDCLGDEVDAHLVIVGGANAGVFSKGAPLSDNDRIIQAGPVSDRELKALYTHAAAFVFPSLYEGFGFPPLEAMACGCVIVASDAASIPEICGDAALYCDAYDVESIASALRRILRDGALREQLAAAAAIRVRRFSWRRYAETLLGMLIRQIG